MQIERATKSDLEEILGLQKLAFYSEAAACNDFTIPPLRQTLGEIEEEFDSMLFVKAVFENKIIGSVRANEKDKTCYVYKLIVNPDFQNKGIGTKLMNYIENEFENCVRFELFTGKHSHRNIYLYNKLGYKLFKEQKINDKLSIVFMEKHK